MPRARHNMRMKRPVRVALALIAAVAATGCGSDGGSSRNPAPEVQSKRAAEAPAERIKPGAQVATHVSRYGRILTDGDGRTLYLFTRDTAGRSRCYGPCAKAWPPLLTRGKPVAAAAARGRLLGTTRRRGGAVQVTYRAHPLYYYVGDRRPGEVLCQNVVEYGGTWLVADPAGRPVH
jgi:predicted lipoprotein with Yx(FWY)xxD motif